MSYIVPREKPKACRNCEFLYKTVYDCKLMCDKDYEDFDTQYANCPLIEVPTPHGRLIDADALITKVQKLYCKDCILRTGKKNGKMQYIYEIGEAPCRGCWIDDMVLEIDDAPTIIEAEGSKE